PPTPLPYPTLFRSPRTKLPEWLFAILKSGVHSAPERDPGTSGRATFVALMPEAPLVAPYGTPGLRVVPLDPPLTSILAAGPESRATPPPPPPPGPCRFARLNA